jgi:hypothetical protein
MNSVRIGMICAVLWMLSSSSARAQSPAFDEMWKAPRTTGPITQTVPKIGDAGCSLNHALTALAVGTKDEFLNQVKITTNNLSAVSDTLDRELKTGRYGRKLRMGRWAEATDIDKRGLNTQADLIQRILATIQEEMKALGRLQSGGSETDLSVAIDLSGRISRLLTMYLTT